MSRLPILTWQQVTTALKRAGFVFDRQKGSHCAVNLAGLEDEEKAFSCYNTNIASPILIIPREFKNTQTYLEISVSCQS